MSFLEEVSRKLTKGKTAVIAEIDETWTVPVDTRLEALDGIVFRRLSYEVEDDQLRRESEAVVSEYNKWKEEVKTGIDSSKARMNRAFANMKEKAQITKQQIERKVNEVHNELATKIRKMEQQMKNAGERRKARLQKRINDLKEEYSIRVDKLQKASSLITEAFGLKKENITSIKEEIIL